MLWAAWRVSIRPGHTIGVHDDGYDNLDRPTLVTQPDGSLDRACYTNNEVLRWMRRASGTRRFMTAGAVDDCSGEPDRLVPEPHQYGIPAVRAC